MGDTPEQVATCVIRECHDPVDPRKVVEMSSAERPYKVLCHACPRHLDMFQSIGLPILPSPDGVR